MISDGIITFTNLDYVFEYRLVDMYSDINHCTEAEVNYWVVGKVFGALSKENILSLWSQ